MRRARADHSGKLGPSLAEETTDSAMSSGRPGHGTVPTDGLHVSEGAGIAPPCTWNFPPDPPEMEGLCTTISPGIVMMPPVPGSCVAGEPLPCDTLSRSEWLAKLEGSKDLVSLGIALAWGLSHGYLTEVSGSAEPLQVAGRKHRSGELFPLPVNVPLGLTLDGNEVGTEENYRLAIQCWTALGCASINSLYKCPRQGFGRKPGKVHARALADMEEKIDRFLKGEKTPNFCFEEVVTEMKTKRINYAGEEVSQPHPLSVSQIIKGLPPIGHGSSIPVLPFLRGRSRYLMENPEESLLDFADRGSSPVTAKVHIKRGEELSVFNLLHERGIVDWVTEDTAYRDARGIYLSGLFGVIKPNKFTDDGQPILRVITNLIPANGLFSVLRGDIDFLPSATEWLPMAVAEGELVLMNQADMQSAFYLFAIPKQWYPYFCLNFSVNGAQLGLDANKIYRPTIKVLPMGWSSSVGIMQQVSREILLSHGLPPELELRKSGNVPLWFTQVIESTTPTRAWWQVYLDNFFSGEVDTGGLGQTGLQLQELAMKAWGAAGVLSAADKQVLRSPEVVELGIRFDGAHGLIGGSPERLLKTIWATLYLMRRERWSQREVQVVLGRWVFLLQFRRAAMGFLSKAWKAVETPWPAPKDVNILLQEVMRLVCVGPLLQTDLRAAYDGTVTVSDASETGGAAAMSKGLSWSGQSLVANRADVRLGPIPLPILVVSCFNGIGGAFRLYDILGITPMGRISIDISKTANRTTRSTWPGVLELHDVESITKEEIRRWAGLYPRAVELHLYAGFPCIHLSSVRAYRQNLDGDGSRLFWRLLEIIQWIKEVFEVSCKVKTCVENVASMDEEARWTISKELDITPIKLDPSDITPISRPRFAWVSEEVRQMSGVELWTEKEYVRAYLHSEVKLHDQQWIRPGWSRNTEDETVKFPTFMKAIKRRAPPPFPAGLPRATAEMVEMWTNDSFRYPPYQYHPRFWVCHPTQAPRLLDASERELLLGFGPGHTDPCQSASVKKRNLREHEDIRCSLCGDSFAIVSFTIIAAVLCQEFLPRMTPTMILSRLGLAPGASAHPSQRIPLTRWLAYGETSERDFEPEELVKQLGLSVNHTGADVRVLTGQILGHKPPNHASVRSWWWQWKQLFTVKWSSSMHINYLEMKMILLTLLWKCRSPASVCKRWLHLEDSMVSLLILSKGRTSSNLLQPLCNRVGAVQLAMGSYLLHGHVASEENPTDKGSRR